MSRSHKRNTLPVEAEYISLARCVLSCQEKVEEFTRKTLEFKRQCASKMHAVNVTSFEFKKYDRPYPHQEKGNNFEAVLGRPIATRVSVRKLYTLLGNGEITLDQFFDCVIAPEKAVLETLGEDELARVQETYEKGLDLVITEK